MALQPGDKLGHYEILSLLGVGDMVEVYKASDTRLDRAVAVKVLPEHIAKREDLRARFEREARAVASLKHPNICVLHDIGSQGWRRVHGDGVHGERDPRGPQSRRARSRSIRLSNSRSPMPSTAPIALA